MNGGRGTEVAAHHSLAEPPGVPFLCEDNAPDAARHHRVLRTHAPRGQCPWEGDAPGTSAFGGVSARSPPSPSEPSTPSDGPIPAPVGAELALLQPLLNRRVPPVQGQGLRPHRVQSMAGHGTPCGQEGPLARPVSVHSPVRPGWTARPQRTSAQAHRWSWDACRKALGQTSSGRGNVTTAGGERAGP